MMIEIRNQSIQVVQTVNGSELCGWLISILPRLMVGCHRRVNNQRIVRIETPFAELLQSDDVIRIAENKIDKKCGWWSWWS